MFKFIFHTLHDYLNVIDITTLLLISSKLIFVQLYLWGFGFVIFLLILTLIVNANHLSG
jgi:hypothetical protein